MDKLEKAIRGKYRFPFKGQVSVEDLYDLRVEDLDGMYRQLNGELKAASEVSLLSKPTKAAEILADKVDIVKHVVEVKLIEAAERQERADRRAKAARIKELIAEKQDESLKGKSEKELMQLLAEYEN